MYERRGKNNILDARIHGTIFTFLFATKLWQYINLIRSF